jgi:hypothetical protein
VPCCFRAEDPQLLDAIARHYEPWSGCSSSAAPVSIELQRGTDFSRGVPSPEYRVEDARLSARGAGFRGGADAQRGTAWAEIDPSLSPEWVVEVIDPVTLFLITGRDRIPLHASAILIGGTAVLLAGASGAGKSTLALHAARAGLPVLSEDTVHIQLQPALRAWGSPGSIHVGEDEPLASGTSEVRLRNGKLKRAVPRAGGAALFADRVALCLLERGERASLERLTVRKAESRMVRATEAGFDRFREDLPEVVRAIRSSRGVWSLTLSGNPADAIATLLSARW